MKQIPQITESEIYDYKEEQWLQYASFVDTKRRYRFELNCNDQYRVTINGQIVYLGNNLKRAITVWNVYAV